MAYKLLKDGTVLMNGAENGIADDPYEGISDIRNVNLISIPTEASVNFATSKTSQSNFAGSLTTTSASSDTATLTGATGLEVGQAIFFSSLSGGGGGLANATPYWILTNVAGVVTLSTTYGGSSPFNITADSITATWQTYNVALPNYFAFDKVDNKYFMVDSSGQVWSNLHVTTSGFWTYAGNFGGANGGQTGRGLVYYQGSDGAGWIFVFRDSAIDYAPVSSMAWVYGWKPSDGTTGNSNGSCGLKTAASPTTLISHEAMVAPDNKVYFCDSSWIGRWYQTSRTVAFDPTDITKYTFDETAVLPFTDTANCLAPLGNNMLIGGLKNIIYPWDTFSQLPSYPIFVAESFIAKMLTINTNTFILAGNRGRVYYTNGSQAQLYKKIPDHISQTVEPYFTWGGITTTKNQLYISALCRTNDNSEINQYGGLWGIDMDTKALRLTNKLSYGNYDGYISAMIAIISPPSSNQLVISNNPGGTGIYMGWSTGRVSRAVSNGVLNSTTTVTSATIAFTSNDIGSTIVGTGIPLGTIILSINSATSAVMSQTATATSSGVSLTISSGFGIDGTSNPSTGVSTLYTGGETTIDWDLVPIGTVLQPVTNGTVQFKLAVPIVSGESVKLQYRKAFSDSFADISTTTLFTYATSTNGGGTGWNGYSGTYQNVNFQNAQWIQIRAVLTGTNSSPSYVRLVELRLK